jgi:hypothetical protein
MPPADVRCVLVKIHGIGQQKANWHDDFDHMLDTALGGLTAEQRARFVNESVWWADLSVLPTVGFGHPAELAQPTASVDVEYGLVQRSYGNYLASGGDPAMGGTAAFGLPDPRTILINLRDGTYNAADQANDVASYVSTNGSRAQILNRLSRKLYDMHDTYPQAVLILASHSQGTMISYDVLRQVNSRLPRLATWITMGCPLAWYVNCTKWGSDLLDVSTTLTWLNFYDDHDIVGKALGPLVNWQAPRPQDVNVDNVGQGLHAHDHWHNPTVVQRYADLISPQLGT